MLPMFYCPARRLLSSRVIPSHHSVLNFKYSSDKSSHVKPTHPTPLQLQSVYDVLSHDLPRCLSKPLSHHIYADDIIFEDNIRNVKILGKSQYILEFALLRIKAAIFYASIRVNVLKMTQHNEEGTIKVRWNIQGVSNMNFIKSLASFNIMRYALSTPQDAAKTEESLKMYDGFSIFYINGAGLVQKHLADKVSYSNRPSL